jgi:hypothetical protein
MRQLTPPPFVLAPEVYVDFGLALFGFVNAGIVITGLRAMALLVSCPPLPLMIPFILVLIQLSSSARNSTLCVTFLFHWQIPLALLVGKFLGIIGMYHFPPSTSNY